jgi:predicted GIY-YIG superfamily endonuclease
MYVVRILQDTEIMRIYKEVIRRGITENNEQQNNQHEETSATKWKNIRQMVTMVISEVAG